MQKMAATPPRFDQHFRNQFRQLLEWRRDVRRFDTRPLPGGLVDELLEIANLSPSVGLSQPWRFIMVDDAERRTQVTADFEQCNRAALQQFSGTRAARYASLKLAGLREAPVQIATFVDVNPDQGHGLGQTTMPETLHYSSVLAIYSLWLAARTHGVGLGWVSILNPDVVKGVCEVPDHWQFIAYLCLGYPLEEHTEPELQLSGWETRRSLSNKVIRR